MLVRKLLVGLLVIMLSACAAPLTKQDLANIKTIKIVNKFPVNPNFTNIGTTIFNNTYEIVSDSSYKSFLTKEVEEQLRRKGYSVVSESNSNADLILEIIPRDIYGMIDTHGYGFYDKSMFGKSIASQSYVAMNIIPMTGGKPRCAACFGESRTKLAISDMPEQWSSLNSRQKAAFEKSLKADIKKAISAAFPETGL